ncbi:TRAP transporter small permease subunit [Stappia sp.]|jgi:TRAP-type mannitol/chloroaromatic compound transport system permease small subunit|uniref:TRAP transporter small permease subunit n=1 Tax=Stappia sp. TaxID=1870903 RepID=UPI003A99A3B9
MERLASLFAALPRGAHAIGSWMLLILAFVIGYDVLGRKFYDTGSIMLQDLEWHLHGAALMLGLGAAYLRDAHVRVDLFREGFSRKSKLWLEVFGIVFFLIPYASVLFWFSIDYVLRAYASGEGSVSGAGLAHRWIIKSFLTAGFALVVLSAIAVLLRAIDCLRDPEGTSMPFVED